MIPAPLILLLQPGLDPLKDGMFLINHLVLMSDQWSPYPSLTVPLRMSKEGFSSMEKWKKMEDVINTLLSLPPRCPSSSLSFRLIKVTHWPVASRTHWAPMKK